MTTEETRVLEIAMMYGDLLQSQYTGGREVPQTKELRDELRRAVFKCRQAQLERKELGRTSTTASIGEHLQAKMRRACSRS